MNQFQQQLLKHKKQKDEDVIFLHDRLMVEYGWIPLEEFRNLPITTVLNLVHCIKKRKEAELKQMKKGRKR